MYISVKPRNSEPRGEKTCLQGFRPCPTHSRLHSSIPQAATQRIMSSVFARSSKNRAVQQHKMFRALKSRIQKEEGFFSIYAAKTKTPTTCAGPLQVSYMQKQVF